MPIKRIQLSGITRVPSDRMSQSGAVAESLNMCLSETENAPIIPPTNLASELGLPTKEQTVIAVGGTRITYRAVYIHKVNGKSIFIYVKKEESKEGIKETLLAYKPEEQVIITLATGESFIDDTIVSVGNTLIFSTTSNTGYVLYKDNSYTYLGDSIPQLSIGLKPILYSEDARLNDLISVKDISQDIIKASADDWNNQIKADLKDRNQSFFKAIKDLWDEIDSVTLGSRYFKYPVFVRFALKLYDGSYIHHTVPIYVAGGNIRYNIRLYTMEGAAFWRVEQNGMAYTLKATLSADKEVYQQWKDVISSIDMFISAPIIYPVVNSELQYCRLIEQSSDKKSQVLEMDFDTITESDDEKSALKNIILDKSRLFYKVRSWSVDSLVELAAGVEIQNSEELSYTEKLYTKESLPDDFRSNHTYLPERNYILNRRLHSIGLTEVFGRGMSNLYGLLPTKKTTGDNVESYMFAYEIKDNDGTKKYVYSKGNLYTEKLICHPVKKGEQQSLGQSSYYASDALQLLFYPDSRCSAVYIKQSGSGIVKVEMLPHPYLNCAYYIGDLNKKLSDLTFSSSITLPSEDKLGYSYNRNYLFQSPVDNPFYIAVEGRIKFSAEIIAIAAITSALSEGQYGQFALYVFTNEGIFVAQQNTEGKYTSIHPLSRDVCISPQAVLSIDQAIIFVTEKGVMLLSGSQLQCLSLNMTGKPYMIEDCARPLLNSGYTDTYTDNTSFIDYLKTDNLQLGYDYSNSRVLFVNETYQYMYVYMLKTNSWHKYVIPAAENSKLAGSGRISRVKFLNYFPSCLLFCAYGLESCGLFYMSRTANVSDDTTEVTGIIATRAFNLDEPDILKTINHIKIRGQYHRFDANGKPRVSYILLGSQNGLDFYRLKSLRGKAWKYYRIIIVSKLNPTERISWIDIDYESRFVNKLR